MRVQMLGLCRYSYLGLRGYQVDHDRIEDRRAYLYDPARLERRWLWFSRVALPAWRAQSDPDFTLVVMTGPDLPEPHLSRLRALCDEVPQLRLELVPPMDRHLEACRAAIEPHLDRDADVVGHFRHDDDDAVAVDYIARSRADFARVRGLWSCDERLSLDHSRGLMLTVRKGSATVVPRLCHNMGVALTVFLKPDHPGTALHFNHARIGLWMPGVAVTQPLMFLRSIHADSDSGAEGPGTRWQLDPDDLDRQLQRRFRLSVADLERLATDLKSLESPDLGAPGAC